MYEKLTKFPNFYMIFAGKMPEFYIIITRKNIFGENFVPGNYYVA